MNIYVYVAGVWAWACCEVKSVFGVCLFVHSIVADLCELQLRLLSFSQCSSEVCEEPPSGYLGEQTAHGNEILQ